MSEQKFDVEKRQNSLFKASVQNALLANKSIGMAQNSMLALGLAELAFLGTLLASKTTENICVIKVMTVLLIVSFLLFLFGQIVQYKHQLKTARAFEAKSNKAIEYLNRGDVYLDDEPKELSTQKQQIVSSNLANYLIFSSFLIIISITVGITWLIVAL